MKKILLTTTAMVAFAGAAAAEVTISGSAEMGLVSGDRYGFGSDVQFHSDIDVRFTLSGETDNGLTFGATIDLDESGNMGAGTGNTFTSTAVFISGAFGTITMGDTDGALDWAMQDVGMGSSLADDHTTHLAYMGNNFFDGAYGGQILRYDNTFGDFGVALSAQIDDFGVGDTIWGIGVKYNAALGGVDLGLGIGFEDAGTADEWGISVDAKFDGGFRAILNYTDFSFGLTHTAIGVGYSSGAFGVSANWGEFDTGGGSFDSYGVQADYDLGGGAQVQFGYGSDVAIPGSDSWSLGLAMSF